MHVRSPASYLCRTRNAHLSTSLVTINQIVQYFLTMEPCLLSIAEARNRSFLWAAIASVYGRICAEQAQGTKKCPIDSFRKLTDSGAEKDRSEKIDPAFSEVLMRRCLWVWSIRACAILLSSAT